MEHDRSTLPAEIGRARILRASKRLLFACTLGSVALLCTACGGSGGGQAAGSPSQLLAAGLSAQKTGNYSVAATDYKAVVQASPNSNLACYAYYDLGVIEQIDTSPANLPAAQNYYQKCIAINPNFSDALYNLAIILTKSSPAQAEADYAQVIAFGAQECGERTCVRESWLPTHQPRREGARH